MTGKSFSHQVIGTIIALTIASVTTLCVGVMWPRIGSVTSIGDATRSTIPVYVAVAAGWLAFCLQRRVAYTKALHDLWLRLVPTIQDAIQYTALDSPDQTKYLSVRRDLSCRIDEIRGIFRNVREVYRKPPDVALDFVEAIKEAKTIESYVNILDKYIESDSYKTDRKFIGVYPFESLQQVHATITRLGFEEAATKERRYIARQAILALWSILRAEMLKELDRDYPEFPDTPYSR